jgi:F-type H+-transporting ATPase subunit O
MLAGRFAVRTARSMAPRVSMAARRCYAAPAAADSKPPIELYGVDGTYASALVCNIHTSMGLEKEKMELVMAEAMWMEET